MVPFFEKKIKKHMKNSKQMQKWLLLVGSIILSKQICHPHKQIIPQQSRTGTPQENSTTQIFQQ